MRHSPEAVAFEAVAEASYQLAVSSESQEPGGIRASLGVLQAISCKGTKETRALILAELAAYEVPFCALQIGAEEDGR